MTPALTDTPRAASDLAAIDALLQSFNRNDAPGLVIGVARHGRTIYRKAVGMASLELGVANAPHTRMRIGSTSKHFACLAVMLLSEQGRLNLDDPVRRHLPELPNLGLVAPTLRQLMNHTSGWRCHVALSFAVNGLAILPKGGAMPLLTAQSALNFEPGSQMIYSNGGYRLLNEVIERVSGQRFDAFLAEHILQPLGMLDTESVASDFEIRRGMATLYQAMPPGSTWVQGAWCRGIFPSQELGAEGAIVSTVDDMLRWVAHLRSAHKRVGSAASWAEMTAPTRLSSGAMLPYGLGLMTHRYRGLELLHHSGGVVGGASQMLTVPAQALDVVIMTNGALVSPVELAYKVVDLLLDAELSLPAQAMAAADDFRPLCGQRYHDEAGGALLAFGDVAGKLGWSWLGMPAKPLRQDGDRLWLATDDLATSAIELQLPAMGQREAPELLMVHEGGCARQFKRLPQPGPRPAALAGQLCGSYRFPDAQAHAQIRLEGERLKMQLQGRYGSLEVQLEPWSERVLMATPTDALLAAAGGGVVVNLRAAEGAIVNLQLDALRMRKLRLLRDTDPR